MPRAPASSVASGVTAAGFCAANAESQGAKGVTAAGFSAANAESQGAERRNGGRL